MLYGPITNILYQREMLIVGVPAVAEIDMHSASARNRSEV